MFVWFFSLFVCFGFFVSFLSLQRRQELVLIQPSYMILSLLFPFAVLLGSVFTERCIVAIAQQMPKDFFCSGLHGQYGVSRSLELFHVLVRFINGFIWC